MNFEQLRYVKEIMDVKSMSIAAKNLFITQSAISQSISLLEQELGVVLFKRSRIGTLPTEDGKKVIRKILELLEKERELQELSKIISSDFVGELKIATSPSIFMTLLLQALVLFKKDYPQIKLTIVEMEKEQLLYAVRRQEVDVGLLFLFEPGETLPTMLQFDPLHYEGNFMVLVAKDSPLALSKEMLTSELANYPFIMYDRTYFQQLVTSLEEQIGTMNIVLRSKNSEVIKRAVAANLGISIVSSLMIKDDPYIEAGRIVAIPLRGNPVNFRLKAGGVYLAQTKQLHLIRKFLSYM
ncbi:MAG: LysR family transcriptional regulator [Kurthia sp.]|nr:LysR family transcriptional regulator [Candidatus Kurthia equi]